MKKSKLVLSEVTELILQGKSLSDISEKFGYTNNNNLSSFLHYKKTSFTKIKNGLSGANLAVNNRRINELQKKYGEAPTAGVKAGIKKEINKLLRNNGVTPVNKKKDELIKLKAEKKVKKLALIAAEKEAKRKLKAENKQKQEVRAIIEREKREKEKKLSRVLDSHEKQFKKTLKFYEVDYKPLAYIVEEQGKRIKQLEKLLK